MRRIPFNDGWTVGSKANSFAEQVAGAALEPTPVTLPHDALIGTGRSPAGNGATAYFPAGTWEYRKVFEPSSAETGSAVFLEFEGVYRDARVRVNGSLVAHRPGGYSDFTVQVDHLLRFGEPNEVKVDARAHEDSRWYSGAGIYRSVWLLQGGRVHLVPGALQVVTPEIDDDGAVVSVSAGVRNQSITMSDAILRLDVLDADGATVARAEAPVTTVPGDAATARQRLWLAEPHRWGPDDPYLYTCRATLVDGDEVLDEESTPFGIRSLSLDPARGLRINGEPVLLRGACVHHDNGLLGAATIDRAEERRVELLKEAGFRTQRAVGTAEVVCYHDDPDRSMADLTDDEMVAIVTTWRARTQALQQEEGVAHVLIFENRGAMVGTSNPHPHCQIYAGSLVYATMAREAEVACEHHRRTGRSLLGDVIEREVDGPRVISEGEHFFACVPWFAQYAYEVLILPRRPATSLLDLDDEECRSLALVLRDVVRRYDALWGFRLPYVLAVHQAPVGAHPDYPFHLELHPPLRAPGLRKYLAGPEVGGGSMTNESDPDEKAEELRAAVG